MQQLKIESGEIERERESFPLYFGPFFCFPLSLFGFAMNERKILGTKANKSNEISMLPSFTQRFFTRKLVKK